MGYVFRKEPDSQDTTDVASVELRLNSAHLTLSELVSEFECFLRGCGFSFDGRLDTVDE